MATETTLRMYFEDALEKEMVWNVKHANPTAGASVRPLMEATVNNKTLFVTEPVTIKAAEFITTETTAISL